tara:strand:- start:119 stop:388 length:270 start_codon:yes stop_codon:yes gene_type:complete
MKTITKKKDGFINHVSKMLYTLKDIQDACIKLGFDNEKMFDELTGFPSGEDKCVGILEETTHDECADCGETIRPDQWSEKNFTLCIDCG